MTSTKLPYTQKQERLARYAKALAHPARVYILQFLEQQCACFAGNIANELPMAQSSVSQHLKELRDAGLIRGSLDPPRVQYCIHQENWKEARALFSALFKSGDNKLEDCC